MVDHNEFILYLERHPEFYVIMKSEQHIKLLTELAKHPLTMEEIKLKLSNTELKDIELILDSLMEINAVQKFLAGKKYLYSVTGHGKEFLEKYMKMRKLMLGK